METLQIKKQPLRVCEHCGLKAYTTEDLELFVKGKQRKYGRKNWCKACCNKYQKEWVAANPEKAKVITTRCYARRINFQGKLILLKENPRTNICSKCGKSYPGDLKQRTSMHHDFYDSDDPLVGTRELCVSCHMKHHNSIKNLNGLDHKT